MFKSVSMAVKQSLDTPQVFNNKESFNGINFIVKNSQLVEQVIARMSGFQSRTSIIEI